MKKKSRKRDTKKRTWNVHAKKDATQKRNMQKKHEKSTQKGNINSVNTKENLACGRKKKPRQKETAATPAEGKKNRASCGLRTCARRRWSGGGRVLNIIQYPRYYLAQSYIYIYIYIYIKSDICQDVWSREKMNQRELQYFFCHTLRRSPKATTTLE
jgi:hypothetical protein